MFSILISQKNPAAELLILMEARFQSSLPLYMANTATTKKTYRLENFFRRNPLPTLTLLLTFILFLQRSSSVRFLTISLVASLDNLQIQIWASPAKHAEIHKIIIHLRMRSYTRNKNLIVIFPNIFSENWPKSFKKFWRLKIPKKSYSAM